ncbi:MAG: D-lyxose/D-mannose family sugar isomerase [Acidobacteriota bacterium]
MKRSEINRLINDAKELLHRSNMSLPPFAYWSTEDWKRKGPECDEIRACRLGWDVTDFGLGRFDKAGLVIFTVRNGHPTIPEYRVKTYCEKIIIIQPGQRCPLHFHWSKTEDIINRYGGKLVFRIYDSSAEEKPADTDVVVSRDGVKKSYPPGAEVVLGRGESLTIPARMYHEFWADEAGGPVVAGEVSAVNDDQADNRFLEPVGRFPRIEEDCLPVHYLCTEYPISRE